jgi:hypothetical protein
MVQWVPYNVPFNITFAMYTNYAQRQGTLTEGEDSVPLTSLLW